MKRTFTKHVFMRASVMLLMTMLTSIGAWATVPSLSGSGTVSDPYVIDSNQDWETFADEGNAATYWASGVHVKLGADIGTPTEPVTATVGTSTHKYKGIFIGNGKTLRVRVDINEDYAALFRYVDGATIKLLKVVGNIYTNGQYGSTFIGNASGNVEIKLCINYSYIQNRKREGDCNHGGFVGKAEDGSHVTFTDCKYGGVIQASNEAGYYEEHPSKCAGFVGYRSDTSTLTFTSCLMTGTLYVEDGNDINGSRTFCYNANSTNVTFTKCYYITKYGLIAQGTARGSMTNAELGAALGPAWDSSASEPIINPKNVAIATVTGVQSLYINDGSLTIDYTVTAADGTVLNHDSDIYTTYIDNKTGVERYGYTYDGTHTYTLKVRGKGEYEGINQSVTFKVTDGKMHSTATEMFDGLTYETGNDVTVSERITVNGTVVLNIAEGKTLTASKGIELSAGNQLTINGPGTLLINNCDENKAGIGAVSFGTLIINSGTINVTGGLHGSGIGGDRESTADGTIIINGGVVNATGGSNEAGRGSGAGIGGGIWGKCGTITINGGQVTAKGGPSGVGIGPYVSETSGSVKLGWTNATDFIDVNAGANYTGRGYSTGIETLAFATGDQGKFVIDGEKIAATTTNILDGCKIIPKTAAMDNNIAYATISGVNSDYQYIGGAITVNPSLTDVNGNALTEGTDYTQALTFGGSPATEVNAGGTYTYTFTGMGSFTGEKSVNFIVATPQKPTNLKQTAYSETSATLSWTKKGTETRWTLEYSTDNTFASGVTTLNVTATSIVLDGLTAEETYYARVRACIGDGGSDWSNTASFYTTAKTWIGCGSGLTDTNPTSTRYNYCLSQQIYTAAEMGNTASIVKSLDFMLTAYTCERMFDIYMVHTDKTSFTADNDWIPYTNEDKVFSGSVNFSQFIWTTIPFDKEFVYNGTQNVALIIVDKTGSTISGGANFRIFSGGDNTYLYIHGTNLIDPTSATGYRTQYRNQIRLLKTDVNIVSLADNTDNTTTLDNNDGKNSVVTLDGRTIYTDGDWNTLCLPFDMTEEQIAASPLAGFTIKELLVTSNLDGDGKLTLNFSNVASIDAGKPYIVKYTGQTADFLIHNASDWDTFASNVNSGTTYQGQIVKLADDFDNSTAVTTMVGDNNTYKFKGTFDGNGKTLKIALELNQAYVAPFRNIEGATIKSLKVEGTISGFDQIGGIVGVTHGDVTIENCECKVAITCTTYDNNARIGGIVCYVDDGTTTIKNCLFSGSLSGKWNGGIVYRVDGCNANISNCLFAPSSIATADTEHSQVILCHNYYGLFSIQKCYYNSVAGINYGTSNGGEAASTDNDQLLADLGDGWEIVSDNVVPKMQASDIVNPVFKGVTIDAAAPTEVTSNDGNVNFLGQYNPFTIDDSNIKSVILLGSNNKLGYSTGNRTLRCFRAHFFVPATATARSFELNFGEDGGTTGVFQIENGELKVKTLNSGWYTLGGLKLQGEPTEKGVYIYNGKKVVLK